MLTKVFLACYVPGRGSSEHDFALAASAARSNMLFGGTGSARSDLPNAKAIAESDVCLGFVPRPNQRQSVVAASKQTFV